MNKQKGYLMILKLNRISPPPPPLLISGGGAIGGELGSKGRDEMETEIEAEGEGDSKKQTLRAASQQPSPLLKSLGA